MAEEKPPSGKCAVCGERVAVPIRCKYCGNIHCIDHHLPKNHNCPGLLEKEKVREQGSIIYRSPDSISTTEIDRPSFFEKHDEMIEKIIEAHSSKNILLWWLGVVFIFIGGFLFIGNVSGNFPTFPFVGFITMTIGWLLLRALSG